MTDVEIPLTKGQVTFVSQEDADLALLRWHADFKKGAAKDYYVARRSIWIAVGKKDNELMHRVILSRMLGRPLLRSEEVDHKDLNPLNNRRENLRLATHSQNVTNQRRRSTNKSGFKGVYFRKRGRKWGAAITHNHHKVHLGTYNTPEEAYAAYCKAAKELHGEFARTGITDRAQADALINQYGAAREPLAPYSNNSSGYRGVRWDKSRQHWYAEISVNGKVKYLGRFPTAEEAAEAYQKAHAALIDDSAA